jgi:NADPH2:quinone reductase
MVSAMTHAIRIHRHGGPEVLEWEAVDVPAPGSGEVLVRHTAIGLNFFDVYERSGLYETSLPLIPGREAAGVVEAVGAGVKHVAVGHRVAYVGNVSGAYSERRVIAADRVVRLPDAIDDRTAAAIMLKGLTAQMLLRQVYRVRRGDRVLIHAAAGGVGSLLVPWAKHLGAWVLGLVGDRSKVDHVRARGADEVLTYSDEWVSAAKKDSRGAGVHVVYDSVGEQTFWRSLDALRPRGMMVSFGNSSGPAPAFAPLELSKRGSLYLSRPTLFDYTRTRASLVKAVQELFEAIAQGVVEAHIGQTFALRDAAEAHRALESRRTRGSTVLIP